MSFWNTFWDIVWYSILAFAFIGALMALFAVITDLFRDRALNGWWKAVWVFFLVFFPFITVFVYLIVRGGGLAERAGRARQHQQQAAESYIREVAASSPADEISKAHALLQSGAITQSEFDAIKRSALGSEPQHAARVV